MTTWDFDPNAGRILDQDNNVIAEVVSAKDSEGYVMAAAPDLLEALQFVDAALRQGQPSLLYGCREVIRAAIAKAEGRAY